MEEGGKKRHPSRGTSMCKGPVVVVGRGVMWQEEETEGWCARGKARLKLFQPGLVRHLRPEHPDSGAK